MFRAFVYSASVGLLVIPALLASGPDAPAPDPSLDEARLLARYGESSLALELRLSGADRYDEFDVRLLTEIGQYAHADSLLSQHAPLGDDIAVFEHYLQRVHLNLMAGRPGRAMELMAEIESLDHPTLSAHRDYLAMQMHRRNGHAARAVEIGQRARARGLPGSLTPEFEMELAQSLQDAGRVDEALELTAWLMQRVRGRDRARVRHLEYEIYVRQGDFDAARNTARELASDFPGDPGTYAAVSEVLSQFRPDELTVSELLAYTSYYNRSGRSRSARPLVQQLERRSLPARLRENSRIVRAQHYYGIGNYRRAIQLSKPSYRDPELRRQSILVLARSYRKVGRRIDAARLYEYFAKAFPNDSKASEALFVAARIFERDGHASDVQRVENKLRKGYPSTYHGRVTALRIARRLAGQGKYDAAVAVLSARVTRSRYSDEAAMYHLAHTYQAAGRSDQYNYLLEQIAKVDPYSFYLSPDFAANYTQPLIGSSGRLAMYGPDGLIEFLEDASSKKAQAYQRVMAALTDGPQYDDDIEQCIGRGRWFLEVGFRDWGERELEDARGNCYRSLPATMELARVYDEFAMPWRSVRLYQKVKDRMNWKKRQDYAEDFRRLLYPTPFPVQVLQNAARYNLPPHLAYGIIREESRFEVEAVSRVGALGLMQLMPSTGRYVARELELPELVEDDLLDPDINLMFGIWYAASLLQDSKGNPHRMLAAYNAGPGNAKRWFDRRGGDSIIDIVDDIDYKETRGYVRRIVESANVYHTLYFDADTPAATQ